MGQTTGGSAPFRTVIDTYNVVVTSQAGTVMKLEPSDKCDVFITAQCGERFLVLGESTDKRWLMVGWYGGLAYISAQDTAITRQALSYYKTD